VLDNLSSSAVPNLKEHLEKGVIEFLRGDIRDFEIVNRSMRDADIVFHEAAQVSAPLSIEDPAHTDDVNVKGTLRRRVSLTNLTRVTTN